jgi:hypothetical protein
MVMALAIIIVAIRVITTRRLTNFLRFKKYSEATAAINIRQTIRSPQATCSIN